MNYPIILARNLTKNPQNRGFCALLPFETPIFWHFEHKNGIFVSETAIFPWFWPLPSTKSRFLCAFTLQNPYFWGFRAQNRVFCVRKGNFSQVLPPLEHKIGIFVRFCPSGPPFSGLSSTKSGNWGVCTREE